MPSESLRRQWIAWSQVAAWCCLLALKGVLEGAFSWNAPPIVEVPGFSLSYCEIDPDGFGEELETENYPE